MRNCFGILAVAVLAFGLVATPALAEEYSTLIEWAANNNHDGANGAPPITAFGDLQGSWNPNVPSTIGIAFDAGANGLWFANEGTGNLILVDVDAPHSQLRTISVIGFGITADGNSDGVALDMANNRILLTDYQGDLSNFDDLIYEIDYDTGAMTNIWGLDGFSNTSSDGSAINTVLGVCVDGDGGVWVSNNGSLIHSVNLANDGTWSMNFFQSVPGGGSWAGLDYDPCLGEFFVANFANQRAQYHESLTSTAVAQFTAMNTCTAVSSNENGLLYVSGFGDNIVYEHEGIACGGVAVEETTWGALKSRFK